MSSFCCQHLEPQRAHDLCTIDDAGYVKRIVRQSVYIVWHISPGFGVNTVMSKKIPCETAHWHIELRHGSRCFWCQKFSKQLTSSYKPGRAQEYLPVQNVRLFPAHQSKFEILHILCSLHSSIRLSRAIRTITLEAFSGIDLGYAAHQHLAIQHQYLRV